MRILYSSLYILLIFSCSNSSKNKLTPKGYVAEALKIVEEHSINRNSIDFQRLRRRADARLKGTNSIEATYPVIKSMFFNLEDSHSWFLTKNEVDESDSAKKAYKLDEIITFSGKLLNSEIGYINIKEFNINDSISSQKYADSLQQIIKSLDSYNLKGWILDLRENIGGNCWPMLTGLGPLLGNGICGYFIDKDKQKRAWFYSDGKSGVDASTNVKTSKKPYVVLNNTSRIAILTGRNTASSGEVVVVAFHNKNNAMSFGESTAGLSTVPKGFKLSDGSMVFIPTEIYADRKGITFGKEIKPDSLIKFDYYMIDSENDPVVNGAIEWINEEL